MYNTEHDCTYYKYQTDEEQQLELYQNDLLIVFNGPSVQAFHENHL